MVYPLENRRQLDSAQHGGFFADDAIKRAKELLKQPGVTVSSIEGPGVVYSDTRLKAKLSE